MTIYYLTKFPMTHPPDRDDEQAHRVYRFEACFDGGTVGHVCDLKLLQDVVARACRTWKVKKPELLVVNKPKADWSGMHYDGDRIELNRGRNGQNLLTLLHELAHWIVDQKDYAVESHGPEFMWIYIELLDQFNVLPRACSILLCDLFKIEVG